MKKLLILGIGLLPVGGYLMKSTIFANPCRDCPPIEWTNPLVQLIAGAGVSLFLAGIAILLIYTIKRSKSRQK